MAGKIKIECPTEDYTRIFSDTMGAKVGKGNTVDEAQKKALDMFAKDAISVARKRAEEDRKKKVECDGNCERQIILGEAEYKRTNTKKIDGGTFGSDSFEVTVTIQLPAKVVCKERAVTQAEVIPNLESIAIDELGSIPIDELSVMKPLQDQLNTLGIENVADLLRLAD